MLGASLAAIQRRASTGKTLFVATSTVFALSLFSESIQLFSPVRVASLVDVAANTLGALSGAWLYTLFGSRLGRSVRER